MKDSAKGPSAGYIYQFEVALLELSNLEINESISIEEVDDVAKIDENGTYILTLQAKHSITLSGKNFGNTSEDLWKTINIWIDKLKHGILNIDCKFRVVTNKSIPKSSIIYSFNKKAFDDVLIKVNEIKLEQEKKLAEKIAKREKGTTHIKTIERINNVISNPKEFEIITEGIEILESLNIKESFFNNILISGSTHDVKDMFYHNFLGWIQDKSKEFWIDKKVAKFSKEDFNSKYNQIRDNHTLVSAIFRSKKDISEADTININNVDKNEIFIKQINDIERFEKNEILEEAIIDFLLKDVEIAYQIKYNSMLTQHDYEEYKKSCLSKWNIVKRLYIRKSISDYNTEELNEIAIKIYNQIMYEIKVDFQDNYVFHDNNKYVQNGTFLELSNTPEIGWHPEWETKYKK